MNLDSLVISILFNESEIKDQTQRIDGILKNFASSAIKILSTIASFDFLKDQVERVQKLATQMDNLTYITNISSENLQAWGEAVQRNGGTTEQFIQSVTTLSAKIREMQTNFGTPGQLAFMRLGINIKDTNGHIKDAVQILGELGNKFQTLPKVWQLKLGEQLGLDPATIRLLASGDKSVTQLVAHMKELGDFNTLNKERAIAFRNSMLDLRLVFQSLGNIIVDTLLPPLKIFTDVMTKIIVELRKNPGLIQAGFIALAVVMTSMLIPAFLSLARMSAPFLLLSTVIAGIALVIQDVIVWMRGGQSAFGRYYQIIADATQGIRTFISEHKEAIIAIAKIAGTTIGAIYAIEKLITVFKVAAVVIGIVRGAMLALSVTPVVGAIILISGALAELILNWQTVVGWMHRFGDESDKIYNRISNAFGKAKGTVAITARTAANTVGTVYNETKSNILNMIKNTANSLGFDSNQAATIANMESGLNPNARSRTSSASGVFQLTNATAESSGINNLSQKNDPATNIRAGLTNLKRTSDALSAFLGRKISGGELYLGEMLGANGAKRLLAANQNSPLSQLFNQNVLRANPQFAGMTAGQLRSQAENKYNSHEVNVGNINIHAPGANSQEIGQHVGAAIHKELTKVVTNADTGHRL